jgi:hypothetical protein
MSKTLAFLAGLALLFAPACNTEHQHVVSAEPRHGYDVADNWDQHAKHITVDPAVDVNPVRTQHVLVATVTTFDGAPLGGRRVEWMIPEGGVGAIVEVDQHGVYNHKGQLVRSSPYRSELGEKFSPTFAVTHTNNVDQLLDMGNDDPSDDIVVKRGQTWISITSATEGTTDVIAYAPGIRDWAEHKAFARKHWMDATWTMPEDATNRVGEKHDMMVTLKKQSDGTPLAGYAVTYTIDGGPDAVLDPGGKTSVTVKTNAKGEAAVTLRQTKPVVGKNPEARHRHQQDGTGQGPGRPDVQVHDHHECDERSGHAQRGRHGHPARWHQLREQHAERHGLRSDADLEPGHDPRRRFEDHHGQREGQQARHVQELRRGEGGSGPLGQRLRRDRHHGPGPGPHQDGEARVADL